MVGARFPAATRKRRPKGRCGAVAKALTRKGVFENISFDVRAGEILGFAGLVGAGRSEVMRALVGYDPLDSGELSVGGRPVAIRHPRDAKRHRIALASEDRKALGLILCRSIRENVSIQNEDQYSRSGFMNHRRERELVDGITRQVTVKMNGIQDLAGTLSGGNQQRWCWPSACCPSRRC
jgi:ABC-type sugar transport system ATPase subunit